MKSPELTEFFSLLGKAKKEKKEEFNNLLKEADINLDVLTSTVVSGIKEAKVNQKKQKKKEEKLIEQLDTLIDTIEKPKEVKDITEPSITVGVPEDFDVSKLEEDPITVQDWNNGDDIKFTEVETVDIIKPEPIKTPEISDTVAQAIKFIEETNIKEEIENSDETSIDNLKGEIKQVRDILYKVLAHGPGSGEVNLLKLDDVDEDSAKVDGKFLKYESSSGKFVGADASGGSGITTANVRTGILDVAGIATFRSDTLVGSGISLSPDGDVFATGITSSTKVHVGVDTGVYGEDLVVTGDARVTGILTIGTGSITLDPTAKQLRGLEEIVIGIANTITIKQDSKGEIEFTDAVGTPKSVGIGTTVSVNTSGIITASSFVGGFTGDLTGTASNSTQLGGQAASYYLNYNNFSNTPTIPSNNNQLTNGAGYITGSALNASNLSSGTIPDARFPSTLPAIDGSALTGIAVTDNIRTNTNATFLQNVNVSGTTTATTFIGNLTGNVTGNATGLSGTPNITVSTISASSGSISGNWTVGGTLTYEDVSNIDAVGIITAQQDIHVGAGVSAVGIITAKSGIDLGSPGVVTLSSDTLTSTSTSANTVSSISATLNRSATFQVQVTRGTQYHMTTINVIHNGTVAFLSEYGTIFTGESLATFSADINSGSLRLRVTPTSSDSTTFKVSKTVMKV